MYFGKTVEGNIKPGNVVFPPRNFGKYKMVALVTSAGDHVIFTMADATKMSIEKTKIIPCGVAEYGPGSANYKEIGAAK